MPLTASMTLAPGFGAAFETLTGAAGAAGGGVAGVAVAGAAAAGAAAAEAEGLKSCVRGEKMREEWRRETEGKEEILWASCQKSWAKKTGAAVSTAVACNCRDGAERCWHDRHVMGFLPDLKGCNVVGFLAQDEHDLAHRNLVRAVFPENRSHITLLL